MDTGGQSNRRERLAHRRGGLGFPPAPQPPPCRSRL